MDNAIWTGIVGVVGTLGGSFLTYYFGERSQKRQIEFEKEKMKEDRLRWQFTFLVEKKIQKVEESSETWTVISGAFYTLMVTSEYGATKDDTVMAVLEDVQGKITAFEIAMDKVRLYLTEAEYSEIENEFIDKLQDISMALEIGDFEKARVEFEKFDLAKPVKIFRSVINPRETSA
ncbi:MAG TPA: hypothetical protein VK914_05815 [bacterium]|jgi:hypothetical protein|nr:hypothetical protein [bacterium]